MKNDYSGVSLSSLSVDRDTSSILENQHQICQISYFVTHMKILTSLGLFFIFVIGLLIVLLRADYRYTCSYVCNKKKDLYQHTTYNRVFICT